ncbi:UNVERIFIED_CONTAM: hypothetical protein NCL1_55975, partial [Trichonephila clavipes]
LQPIGKIIGTYVLICDVTAFISNEAIPCSTVTYSESTIRLKVSLAKLEVFNVKEHITVQMENKMETGNVKYFRIPTSEKELIMSRPKENNR